MNLKKLINEEDGGEGDIGGSDGDTSSLEGNNNMITGISTSSFAGWSIPANGRGFDMPKEAVERIKKARKKGMNPIINTPTGFTFDDYIGFAVKGIKKDPNNNNI